MVTAIVIPIICLYFFLKTRKEMKEQDLKWLSAGNIRHEAILTGKIINIVEDKQRFYYHRYIYVQELKLQTNLKIFTAKKVTPLTKNVKIEPFTIGTEIRVYGTWEKREFLFSDYEKFIIKESGCLKKN